MRKPERKKEKKVEMTRNPQSVVCLFLTGWRSKGQGDETCDFLVFLGDFKMSTSLLERVF